MGDVEYEVIKHVATIREGNPSIELNIMKWGNYKSQYDLRKWKDGEPKKGVAFTKEEALLLWSYLSAEFGLNHLGKTEESSDNMNDENIVEENNENKNSEDEKVNYLDYRSFFIRGDVNDCRISGHEVVNITVLIEILEGDEIVLEEIPAEYCEECGIYYIRESIYQSIKRKGRILCQIFTTREYELYRKSGSFDNLNKESILKMLGYSVSKADGLTDAQRHIILDRAIECGAISKNRAISLLEFFVRLNERQPNMREARRKWNEDVNYLRNGDSSNKVVSRIIR